MQLIIMVAWKLECPAMKTANFLYEETNAWRLTKNKLEILVYLHFKKQTYILFIFENSVLYTVKVSSHIWQCSKLNFDYNLSSCEKANFTYSYYQLKGFWKKHTFIFQFFFRRLKFRTFINISTLIHIPYAKMHFRSKLES